MSFPIDTDDARAKTWGPFNGRQLATIICVVAATVLFPTTVFAAGTLTKVTITDPSSGNKAKVDTSGNLMVGDGAGPLTVNGTVGAEPVLPAKPIVIPDEFVGSDTVLYGPATKPFGIGSLTIVQLCSSAVLFTLESRTNVAGPFTLLGFTVAAAPGSGQTTMVHVPFPTPLVTSPPAGGTATLEASASSPSCLGVSLVGEQS